jgi:hypothetical protein
LFRLFSAFVAALGPVVALVRIQLAWSPAPWSTSGADWRNALDEGLESEAVAPVRGGDAKRNGNPLRSQIRWIFDPFLPWSVGFGPVKGPLWWRGCSPSRSRTGTSPAFRDCRARPKSRGGAVPRLGYGSTGRIAGRRFARRSRTQAAAAARCSPRWPRRRSQPATTSSPEGPKAISTTS